MTERSVSLMQKRHDPTRLNGNQDLIDGEESGSRVPEFFKFIALFVGIIIIIIGIYLIVLGITPDKTGSEDESFSGNSGCFLSLGLVVIATGGLFVTFFLRKKGVVLKKSSIQEDLKVCPKCHKRVEVDQELCYHCGNEFE